MFIESLRSPRLLFQVEEIKQTKQNSQSMTQKMKTLFVLFHEAKQDHEWRPGDGQMESRSQSVAVFSTSLWTS